MESLYATAFALFLYWCCKNSIEKVITFKKNLLMFKEDGLFYKRWLQNSRILFQHQPEQNIWRFIMSIFSWIEPNLVLIPY